MTTPSNIFITAFLFAHCCVQPPNIEAYVLPRLEMRFETFKEAKDFYNVYAKHAGFAVREGSNVETRVYLYCTCHGVYESKVSEANRQRNKTTARTNCEAKMRLEREKDGTLVVKEIVWDTTTCYSSPPKCLSSCTPTKTLTKQSWSTSSMCSSKALNTHKS